MPVASYISHIFAALYGSVAQFLVFVKYRKQNVSALMQVLINKMRLTMQSRPEKNFTPAELAEKHQASLGLRLRTGKSSMYMHDIPL